MHAPDGKRVTCCYPRLGECLHGTNPADVLSREQTQQNADGARRLYCPGNVPRPQIFNDENQIKLEGKRYEIIGFLIHIIRRFASWGGQ